MIDQDILEYYPNSNIGRLTEISEDFNRYIDEQLKNQYIYLQNLGYDFVNGFIINDNIYYEFLDYVDNTYINIVDLQNFFDNPAQLQIIGKFIYEILCIDMVNKIIPYILYDLKISNPTDIILMNRETMRNSLINYGQKSLEILQMIYSKRKTTQIKREILKKILFIDLMDNDIVSLKENFINPISNIYTSVLYPRLP